MKFSFDHIPSRPAHVETSITMGCSLTPVSSRNPYRLTISLCAPIFDQNFMRCQSRHQAALTTKILHAKSDRIRSKVSAAGAINSSQSNCF